jgi:hypothetical protein
MMMNNILQRKSYMCLGTNLMKTNIVMECQELVVESMCEEFIVYWVKSPFIETTL